MLSTVVIAKILHIGRQLDGELSCCICSCWSRDAARQTAGA